MGFMFGLSVVRSLKRGEDVIKRIYGSMVSWCFILFFSLSLKTGCSICLV